MIPTASLPTDSYELTVAVTGTPLATAALARFKLTGGGCTFWPLQAAVTLDSAGNGSITAVCGSPGVGNLAAASTVTWGPVAPAGLNAASTVTAARVSPAGYFGRLHLKLLGPAYQAPDGSHNAADALALGGAIAAARATNLAVRAEMFADSASQLLPEWETSYGLAVRPDLTDAQRQTRLLAKIRASRAGTPAGILLAVRTLAPEAALVEWTAAQVAATDPRGVFRFTIVITAAHLADSDLHDQLAAILDAMKPAHTGYVLAVAATCRFDDPTTPFDQSVFGV